MTVAAVNAILEEGSKWLNSMMIQEEKENETEKRSLKGQKTQHSASPLEVKMPPHRPRVQSSSLSHKHSEQLALILPQAYPIKPYLKEYSYSLITGW